MPVDELIDLIHLRKDKFGFSERSPSLRSGEAELMLQRSQYSFPGLALDEHIISRAHPLPVFPLVLAKLRLADLAVEHFNDDVLISHGIKLSYWKV